MVIDSSAILSILLAEEDAETFARAIESADQRLLSAATFVETAIVIQTKKGDNGERELDLLLHRGGIEIVSVDAEQAEIARAAYRRYGKGRHPAGLNYGDCFTYALAKSTGEPVLYKGTDFARTDLYPTAPRP